MAEKASNKRTWVWIVVVAAVALAMIFVCCVAAVAGLAVYKYVDRDYTYGQYGRTIPEIPQRPELPALPELPKRDWDERAFPRIQAGAILTEIIEDSPADDAGLLPGDVIVAVDGRDLTDDYTLYEAVTRMNPGDVIEADIWSHGRTESLQIVLGRHPEDFSVAWLGVYFRMMNVPDGMHRFRDSD